MSHNIEIKEGAFIISDAHFSSKRPELLEFINAIEAKQLQPTQLLLMGDIFDALFGSIDFTYTENQKIIELIEKIAQEIEVIYFEGNHDFNLKAVFQNIKIYPISQQPVAASFQDKKIYLAHGDFDGKLGYKLYTALIRNPIVLKILKPIDNLFNHFILRFVDQHLMKKDDCKELSWFEDFIQNRFHKRFDCDYFIEGHFHQNKTIKIDSMYYINLAAFACNQRYFIVKSLQENTILQEKQFSKGI
ncbi:UDP-2,3-diacylglucosamine diphosphatase [Sulfurimonas sp. C5]|uniref:UDP-2,3-diacylglucosamine diphosphatase n=1 Tax=Sulfurimonas sp. C5 TaxID=3036947 RepID=UPI002458C3D4|nr:UDP-2,3-diacylglucosamine diphosphatase [Sulfurimonas sp. C5]MDH4944970.1 UDP-2,3-diacylglucosamine diphosphatase [Sulfurimonas sp. C5]